MSHGVGEMSHAGGVDWSSATSVDPPPASRYQLK